MAAAPGIRVSVTEQRGRLTATVTGSVSCGVSDVCGALGLSGAAVLRAIRRISGDDRYDKFHFTQTKKTLTPIPGSALVTESRREPLVRTTRTYRNDSSLAASYDGRLSTSETSSVSVSWSRTTSWESAAEIGYEAIVSGSARFAFGGAVGSGLERSQAVTVTADDGVRVNLQPGQRALASLAVHRRRDTLSVRYRVDYEGDVEAWGNGRRATFDLHEVLDECNRDAHDVITQTITLEYFTDAEVVLNDL